MKTKDIMNAERRRFMAGSARFGAALVAGAGVAGAALADEHFTHGESGLPAGTATTKGVRFGHADKACATCVFWGGTRKLADHGDAVIAQSLGWCNNPKSANYGKMTTPEHVMPQWKKWEVLK